MPIYNVNFGLDDPYNNTPLAGAHFSNKNITFENGVANTVLVRLNDKVERCAISNLINFANHNATTTKGIYASFHDSVEAGRISFEDAKYHVAAGVKQIYLERNFHVLKSLAQEKSNSLFYKILDTAIKIITCGRYHYTVPDPLYRTSQNGSALKMACDTTTENSKYLGFHFSLKHKEGFNSAQDAINKFIKNGGDLKDYISVTEHRDGKDTELSIDDLYRMEMPEKSFLRHFSFLNGHKLDSA